MNGTGTGLAMKSFYAFLLFNEKLTEKTKITNYNYQYILTKGMFDYCFENNIKLPGLNQESINELCREKKKTTLSPIIRFNDLKSAGFEENIFARIYKIKNFGSFYDSVQSMLMYLVINHIHKNNHLVNYDLIDGMFEFFAKRYTDINNYLSTNVSRYTQKDHPCLSSKISHYENVFNDDQVKSLNSLQGFYNWMFSFVSKNFPVYYAIKKVIQNHEELVLLNRLRGCDLKVGDKIDTEGKIIGILPFQASRSYATAGGLSHTHFVEILSGNNILFTFPVCYGSYEKKIARKRNNTSLIFDKEAYTGQDIAISGRVKKIVDNHFIYNMYFCKLNYVNIVRL